MALRDRAKRASNILFRAGDRVGVHLLPAHYYSSLPSWRWLKEHEDQWRRPSSMAGIDWDLDVQAEWIRANVGSYASELPGDRLAADAESVGGLRFGVIEAQALHGIIRTRRPRRLVEIGSGSSTLVMSQAVERNVAEGGDATEILAIDPYTADRVAGLPHVTSSSAHGIDLTAEGLGLAAGDLLFIDSTHAVRTGSEVPNLYLEILPRLPAGVLVHIHDIYLPYLYTPYLYETYFDWQETTLVAALLVGNSSLQVRAGMLALVHERHPVLPEVFPEYVAASLDRGLGRESADGHLPSSLWLETVG